MALSNSEYALFLLESVSAIVVKSLAQWPGDWVLWRGTRGNTINMHLVLKTIYIHEYPLV